MVATTPPSERQILASAHRLLGSVLPDGWTVTVAPAQGSIDVDADLDIVSPTGERARFAVGVRRTLRSALLRSAVERLQATGDRTGQLPLVVSAYLSPTMQSALRDRGVSYADATGNMSITATTPGLFLSGTGATKDPWPHDQPLRSLKGRGASRAMRALLDTRTPIGVRELAGRTGVPAATLSRVIDLLDRESVLTRADRGGVADLDWRRAIERWSQDYELRRSNHVHTYLSPRGLSTVIPRIGTLAQRYALTGSLAAQRLAPVAPARVATVYVENPDEAAAGLDAGPVDSGANVVLIEPYDPVVFERTLTRDGLRIVAPSQLAVDLLTGPGREPAEAAELLDWMTRNEDDWRT